MKLFEVDSPGIDTGKLLQLARFLSNRAEDTGAAKQISKSAFLQMASNMGVSISADQLVDLAAQPPLDGILEPTNPTDTVIKFKGAEPDVAMPGPDQSQQIVATAAKSAMKKDRGI